MTFFDLDSLHQERALVSILVGKFEIMSNQVRLKEREASNVKI